MTASGARAEWADVLIEEVASGVHRVPLPLPLDGLRAVNVYLVVTAEGISCIDGGWALAGSRGRLDDALATIGATVHDIRRFLVTHVHRDHYTQAVVLRRETGSPVMLGEGERDVLDLLRDPMRQSTAAWAEQMVTAGASDLARQVRHLFDQGPEHAKLWELPDAWLSGGEVIDLGERSLYAVATPGHTRGHLVFHDEEAGLLFTGDHVLPHITPSIGFEAAPAALPLVDFLKSLAVVRAMPDARMLPAHGPAVGNVHSRVDELLNHHHTRLDDVLKAVKAGASTAVECASQLGWTRSRRPLNALRLADQVLAVMETLAHLELQRVRGRLRVDGDGGVRRYLPV